MNYTSYFKFSELFSFGDDADADDLVDIDGDLDNGKIANFEKDLQKQEDGDEQSKYNGSLVVFEIKNLYQS